MKKIFGLQRQVLLMGIAMRAMLMFLALVFAPFAVRGALLADCSPCENPDHQ